ncbi:MAG: GNAT family N-acetyltransferase [Chloroflexi bacterium]|nr:GNAT family N-acetyltransferase [Chloroflexota bacterium]MBP8059414.1 GNAT family N-acetyltransferase [Chloroflexota bacterium]
MPWIIRACIPEDAPEIERLYLQSVAHLQSLGDTDDFLFSAEVYVRDGFGANPAFAGLVAEAGEQLLGYLLYQMNYDTDAAARSLFILDLAVDEAARRQGVGRALMDAAADLCRTLGGSELVWAVYNKNQLAFDFYLSLGAKPLTELTWMHLAV